ncbi:hypothetical protein KKC88_01455 [Patescibacteria group bacterium]|nr:hypothetical protein [Patescibacteria group bacterium]MBU1673180.1 hypothetical protein [Patescibacteria group bacterium]MBU1963040.1 hypothetical protein [Patescibacteria group bacterium]
MPISKEEKLSRDLKRAKGQDPDKSEQEKEPNIVRKHHPEKTKMITWVIVATVIIGLIGAAGVGLRMKYKKDDTFSGKYDELKQSFGKTWSGFTEGLPGQDEPEEEEPKKRIISNPDNLSEEEIEELEKKAFPENNSSTD